MKKSWVLTTGLWIILFLCAPNGFAQEPDFAGFVEDGITSPTAASLGKYGGTPVNMATGVPEIGIPLTEVRAGGVRYSHWPPP